MSSDYQEMIWVLKARGLGLDRRLVAGGRLRPAVALQLRRVEVIHLFLQGVKPAFHVGNSLCCVACRLLQRLDGAFEFL